MGRGNLLPRMFAVVHPEHRTPVNAIHFQAIVAIVVAVAGGLYLADDPFPGSGPINIYVWIGTLLGLLFAAMYIAVNAAVIGFYLRERRDEFNVIKHLIVPIIGVIAMIPAFLSVVGGLTIPIVNVTLAPFQGALAWTAPVAAVWMILGMVMWLVLRTRDPGALDRMGQIYGGESGD
jgi:amino acid transporter